MKMQLAGVPERYREPIWDGVEVQDAREWQAHVTLPGRLRRGSGLLIAGPVGRGKSSLAACIARDTLSLGKTVRWEYLPWMLDELEKGKRLEVEERQRRVDLVVWDDFGVDRLADWHIGLLDRIVELRYSARRSMIVTTNTDPVELGKDPGLARITDRWRSMLLRLDVAGPRSRRPQLTREEA